MRTGSPPRQIRRFPWLAGALVATATAGAAWFAHSQGWTFGSGRTAERDARTTIRQPPTQHSARGIIVTRVTPNEGVTTELQSGDRIVACDEMPVISPASLQAAFENTIAIRNIALRIERDGVTLDLQVQSKGIAIETRPDLHAEVLPLYESATRTKPADPQNPNGASPAQAYNEAATRATDLGDGLAAAWLHLRAAQACEAEQRRPDASEAYRLALERCPPGRDDATRSRILAAWSRCRAQLSDADSARAYLEEARRLDAAADRRAWEGSDLHALGVVSWLRSDLVQAQEDFREAVAVREQYMPDSAQLGESLNGLGAVAYQQGDLDRAEMYYRRALELCERVLPDSMAVADALNNLGVVAMLRGNLDSALEINARSLEIRERLAPDSEAVTASLTNMGIVEYRRGRLQSALDHYSRSLAIHERQGPDSLLVARDFVNMGVIAYERGDLDAAQDYYSRSLVILERLTPDSPDCIACVYNLGMVAGDRGDWEGAKRNLERALAYRERTAPDSLIVAETLNALGNLAFSRLDFATAEQHYSRALEIETRLAPDSIAVAISQHNLGGVALQRNQFDQATSYYKRSLVIRERLAPGSLDLASSLHGLGDLALRQGKPGEAVPRLLQAIEMIEAQRDHIHGIESRALLLARYSEPYITLQHAYVALGDPAAAFHTTERARARSLLDGLSEARADIREGVEPTLLAREQAIQEKLTSADQERRTLRERQATESEISANEKLLNELLVEYEDIQGQIRRASPRYAALTQPQPLTLDEIQRDVLDGDTVLLEYALGLERSLLWFVTVDGIQSFPLPAREEVDRAARRVHELLTARNQRKKGESAEQSQARIKQADSEYREAVAALSAMVLGPVADRLGTKRILIVADGALQYVPFGALPKPELSESPRSGANTPKVVADRPPLIVDHEVVTLPSASVLAVLRQEIAGRAQAQKSVAVLADPVLTPEDPRVKRGESAAPTGTGSSQAAVAPTKDDKRGVGRIETSGMQRLPFTRLEAASILALADDPDLAALGFAANKRTAMSPELGDYRIVHLATHGLLDTQHPELSGIVLSMVDEQGRPQDGFLRLHEIYNLRLNADLVVLSACQTALGREVRGEGLVGLTRGFMYAGAARVVASLWSVQDKATAELMQSFYERMLRDGQSPAAALRTAQVLMWKEGREPYYWAAFVLQGEYR